jgi:ankyrin repeat protein
MGAAASLQIGPDGMAVFQIDGADDNSSGGIQSLMESLTLLARMMQNALELTYPEIYSLADFEDPEAKFPLQPATGGDTGEEGKLADGDGGGGGDGSGGGAPGDELLLPRGTRVIVFGLQQSPEYNERCGVVVKYVPDKQRYRVFLGPAFNNKHVALKPSCVRRCSPGETFLSQAVAVPAGAPLEPLAVTIDDGFGGAFFGFEEEAGGSAAAGQAEMEQQLAVQQQNAQAASTHTLVLQAANVANMSGWTPLHACAHNPGDIQAGRQVLEAVVASGGSLDALTKVGPGSMYGWTPLHIASAYCVQPMVELLVDAKADVEVQQGDSGWTALQTACRRGYTGVVQVLLRAKADAGRPIPASPEQPSPPHNCVALAARHGHISCLRALHESGAPLDATNALGWGALHEACNMNAFEVVHFLIEAKCDLNARTKTGRSALQLCRDPLLKDMLLEAGIVRTAEDDAAVDAVDAAEATAEATAAKNARREDDDDDGDDGEDDDAPSLKEGKVGSGGKGQGKGKSKESKTSGDDGGGHPGETEAQRDERFRLLGELPDLSIGNTLGPSAQLEMEHASRARGKGGSRRGKGGKSSSSSSSSSSSNKSKFLRKLRTNNAPRGCPEEFVCDLTGACVRGRCNEVARCKEASGRRTTGTCES